MVTFEVSAGEYRSIFAKDALFAHVSGSYSGVILRDETQTKTGCVEVLVLESHDYHTVGVIQADEVGNVLLSGRYLIRADEIKRPDRRLLN